MTTSYLLCLTRYAIIVANTLLNRATLIHVYLTVPFCLGGVLVPSSVRFFNENLE